MREISKKNTQFVWGIEQENSFEKIKDLISSALTLTYYDPNIEVTLTADSSAHSIGAVCLQNGKPIEFAAKSLTECQQRYSQIEKELLASLYACKRFRYYCFGQPRIRVETDHLPLLGLMNKDINQLSPRLATMRLELLAYPIELVFKPGADMVLADTLSRSCPEGTSLNDDLGTDPLLSVCSVVIQSEEVMNKYQLATKQDEELQVVMRYIKEGWPSHRKACASRAKGYWNLRQSLSVVNEVVFYGSRLVIPVSLRNEVVVSLHSAHQGVTKVIQRASNSVFWPGLRKRLEEKCLSCDVCMQSERCQTKEPLRSFPVPEYPFQTIGVDLFHLHGDEYLLAVDYLTKWPVVKLLPNNTTSKSVVQCMKEIFSDYGRPEVVVSDNGPQFSSMYFKTFCKEQCIKHTTSSPLHSSGNGQAERCIGTVKSMMKKCLADNTDWLQGLTAIRNTPIGDQCLSPSELLQGRILRDHLPVDVAKYKVRTYDLDKVRSLLEARKCVEKFYHDNHAGQDKFILQSGQQVYFKAAHGNWRQGKIDKLLGDRSYLIQAQNTTVRRNRNDIRRSLVDRELVSSSSTPLDNIDSSEQQIVGQGKVAGVTQNTDGLQSETNIMASVIPSPVSAAGSQPPSNMGRTRKKPVWHQDYQMY